MKSQQIFTFILVVAFQQLLVFSSPADPAAPTSKPIEVKTDVANATNLTAVVGSAYDYAKRFDTYVKDDPKTTTTPAPETTTTSTTPANTNTTSTTPSTTSTTPQTTTRPTTSTTSTTTTTSTTSTTPSTTTPAANTTTEIPPTTTTAGPTPAPPKPCRRFYFLSFIGGIIFTLGFIAISFVLVKIYKSKFERNYHTL